jgi:hypothetical protein
MRTAAITAALQARAQAWLRGALASRAAPFSAAEAALLRAEPALARAHAAVAPLSRRLDATTAALDLRGRPFSADFTVDMALRRHPGAAAVLAAHHLPGCAGCAVRFDETLAEAAAAYALPLPALLESLNALLGPPGEGPTPAARTLHSAAPEPP